MTVTILPIIGQVIKSVKQTDDTLVFTMEDGRDFMFWHQQDCCEYVYIEDVNGDWENIINFPLIIAEEFCEFWEDDCGSYRYTFYKFATIKGYVDVRWYGSSNGYYSEAVDYNFC